MRLTPADAGALARLLDAKGYNQLLAAAAD